MRINYSPLNKEVMYPSSDYPNVPIRKGPRNYKAISKFYHDINPHSCDVFCSDVTCDGHKNELDLNYELRGENVFGRCKICRSNVKIFPGKYSFLE